MTREDDRRTGRITATTREAACLALGHDDADEPRCRVLDEDLVRQLVEEVQGLRVAAGIVEETAEDREEREAIVAEVLTDDRLDDLGDLDLAVCVLDLLAEAGWTLHRVHLP